MSAADPAPFVWIDGKVGRGDQVALGLANHSLHYGLAVFEGVNAFPADTGGHHLFRIEEHVARMAASCALVGLSLPCSEADIVAGCHEVMHANGLRRAYLRPIAYLGDGVLGLAAPGSAARVAILAFGAELLDDVVRPKSVRLTVSGVPRVSAAAMPMKAKTSAGYLNARMATLDAWQRGFDEALMLDADGLVAECTVQNIVGFRGETVLLPVSDAALDGITVASVADLATDLGLSVSQRSVTRAELLACEALCVASTAGGVRPVSVVDDLAFDVAHPAVVRVRRAYDDAERGRHPRFAHWTRTPAEVSA